MAAHDVNGIRIEVEERGDRDAPAFLLVRGLGTQLVRSAEFEEIRYELDGLFDEFLGALPEVPVLWGRMPLEERGGSLRTTPGGGQGSGTRVECSRGVGSMP